MLNQLPIWDTQKKKNVDEENGVRFVSMTKTKKEKKNQQTANQMIYGHDCLYIWKCASHFFLPYYNISNLCCCTFSSSLFPFFLFFFFVCLVFDSRLLLFSPQNTMSLHWKPSQWDSWWETMAQLNENDHSLSVCEPTGQPNDYNIHMREEKKMESKEINNGTRANCMFIVVHNNHQMFIMCTNLPRLFVCSSIKKLKINSLTPKPTTQII